MPKFPKQADNHDVYHSLQPVEHSHTSGSWAETKSLKDVKNLLKAKSGKAVSKLSGADKAVTNNTPVTYIPSAASATTVANDTVSTPYSIYGEWEPYFQLIKEQSEANQAKQIKYAQMQNNFQREQNKIAMDFNAAQAAANRDWQEYMSNTAHQREVSDLQAAGLNPVLSATGGNGAAVTSGATASGVTSSGSKPEVDTGTLVGMLNLLNNVMGYAMNTATAGINAGATLGAARYSSDMNYAIHQDFPNTGAALIYSIGNDVANAFGYNSWNAALADLAKTVKDNQKSEGFLQRVVIPALRGVFKTGTNMK